MIIIDQHADLELAQALKVIRNEGQDARCIYFSLRNSKLPIGELHATITAAACAHLSAVSPRLYLCGDGDAFILAPSIPGKDGRGVMLDLATALNIPVSEDWVIFVDLPLHLNKLVAALKPKLEARHAAEDAKKKQSEQLQAQRKREHILSDASIIERDTIGARRSKRDHDEFMIIEDDVFSQRLVENVLQKRYKMTGLKEANHALETYARVAPDLLFLDINLPDVTGHELLERIMAMDPNAYVIMLSGNADRDNITQALGKGAKGFVAKPFNREKLLQYVERCPTIRHHA